MNEKDVGALYTTNGQDAWRRIIYAHAPTATMENVETKERVGGVVGSLILHDFKKLVVQEKP